MAASTETLAEDAPAASPMDRLREALGRLTGQQKVILMVTLAAIIAILVGTLLWSRQPDYKVLFSNISEKDGGAIVTALEQQNVPHKFNSSGSILVPADRVHEVRLRLASQGLPRGGAVGFELMENQKFGISQFAEQVNYQRGLEGELARTIGSIGAVQLARVHLAIPKPSVFVRDELKPTASVMLNLYPGRTLDAAQVAGISHLVSASVPNLPAANVTVLDQNGNQLSRLKSPLTEAGLDPTQIKYVREVENNIIKRIEEILTPMLGPDNFKVQVAADIDFSQTEQTAESYKPNSKPEAAIIRSQQNAETANVNQSAGGVPGALSNQPPVPATAPVTQPGAAGQTARTGNEPGRVEAAGVNAPLNAAGQPISTSKSNTINYEVDKTIRYTKQAMGAVRRLSAAVVVNHRKEVKDGKPVSKALPEAEMKQLNDLVREAMGYVKDRGDTLSVASAPFTVVEKVEISIPPWKDPELLSLAREIFKYLMIAGIIAFLLLKVVQPLLRTMFPSPVIVSPEEEAAKAAAEEALAAKEAAAEEEKVHIDHYAVQLQKARDIAQADPKAVAGIIKDWIGANAS